MKLIQDNLYTEFIRLLQQTTNDLIIVTPFIKADFIENVIRQINPNVNIIFLLTFHEILLLTELLIQNL